MLILILSMNFEISERMNYQQHVQLHHLHVYTFPFIPLPHTSCNNPAPKIPNKILEILFVVLLLHSNFVTFKK